MELLHILIVKSNCMPEKSVFLLCAKMYLNKNQKSKKTEQFIVHKLQTIFIGLYHLLGLVLDPEDRKIDNPFLQGPHKFTRI